MTDQGVQQQRSSSHRLDTETGVGSPRDHLKRELAGLSYDEQVQRVAPGPVGPLQWKPSSAGPVQMLPDKDMSAWVKTTLPTILDPKQIEALRAKLGDKDIEAFVTTVGAGKFKDLYVTKAIPIDKLVAFGADKLKTFKGAGQSTVDHVANLDGISGGEIKGCHDEDLFKATIATQVEYAIQAKDKHGQALMEPVSEKEKQDYDKALQKWKGMRQFYFSEANEIEKGKPGKKLKSEPQKPAEPQPEPKMVTVKLQQGRINSVTPLSTPGVNNHSYDLRKNDDAEFRVNAEKMKTTIKDLQAKPSTWIALANEAIWDAIAKGTFAQKWSGVCSSGATIEGYWNDGDEVNTFFFTS